MDYDNQQAGGWSRAIRTRVARTPRVVSTAAAGVILLGSGVGIGVALTGGAAAASGQSPAASHGVSSASASGCARLARALRRTGHPAASRRIAAFCRDPLLRLAAVGGMYGQVSFKAKDGTKTVAFERGTVRTVVGSVLVVQASDGTTMTWHLVAGSVVRQDGHKVAASKLAAGDLVFVGGQVIGGADDARLVRIRKTG